MQKVKVIAWRIITIIALGYIALMSIVAINMFQIYITDEMRRLTGIVWLFFISGLILRLIKPKRSILPFIIIGDAILILVLIFQGGFKANSFWEIFFEPVFLLNILSIITLKWDWIIRFRLQNYNLR